MRVHVRMHARPPQVFGVLEEDVAQDARLHAQLASLSSVTLELDKVAPFLIKLFEIVSSPTSDYLICWSEMGDSFRIIDRTKFAQVSSAYRASAWTT